MICEHCGKETSAPHFSRSKNRIIEEIKKFVCIEMDIPITDIYLKNRKREIVITRQIIGYYLHRRQLASLGDIATCFGEAISDHTTVIHGIKNVENLKFTDVGFRELIKYMDSVIDGIVRNPQVC